MNRTDTDRTVAEIMRLVRLAVEATPKWKDVRIYDAESALRKLVEERDALTAQFKATGHVPYLERMKQLAERAEHAEAEAAALRKELEALRNA